MLRRREPADDDVVFFESYNSINSAAATGTEGLVRKELRGGGEQRRCWQVLLSFIRSHFRPFIVNVVVKYRIPTAYPRSVWSARRPIRRLCGCYSILVNITSLLYFHRRRRCNVFGVDLFYSFQYYCYKSSSAHGVICDQVLLTHRQMASRMLSVRRRQSVVGSTEGRGKKEGGGTEGA